MTSLPSRRDREVQKKNNIVQQEENRAPPPNSAANNIAAQQQQQQTPTQFFPSNLVTPITADLLDKMRDSSESYRSVVSRIEEVVMLGAMKGLDERTILMQCRAVLEANPIVEVDIWNKKTFLDCFCK